MWTEETIKAAAERHLQEVSDALQYDLMDACMPHDEMDDIDEYIKDAFLAGAKFIIKNTQKQ